VDLALYDVGVALMQPHIPNYLLSGKVPGLTGSAHPNICPYEKFPTATGEVFLAAGNDGAFARLCAELGDPELAGDPRFHTNATRLAHRTELAARLTVLLKGLDGEALCARLLARGIAAGPVRNVAQVWADPHLRARGTTVEMAGYRGCATPIRLSRTPGEIRHLPPRFDQHRDEILSSPA
jgi:formyl-CoA transferase